MSATSGLPTIRSAAPPWPLPALLLESLGHHVAQSWPDAMFEHDFTGHFTAIIAADTEATFRAFEADGR
jgi:hypothetical protein